MSSLRESLRKVWFKLSDWVVCNSPTIIISLLISILFLSASLYERDRHYKEELKLRTYIVALEIENDELSSGWELHHNLIIEQSRYIQKIEAKLTEAAMIINDLLRRIKPPKEPIDPDKWTTATQDIPPPIYVGK